MEVSAQRLVVIAALERAINYELTQLNKEIADAIAEAAPEGVILDEVALALAIEALILAFFANYSMYLILAAGKVADIRALDAISKIVPRLEKLGLAKEARQLTRRAEKYQDTVEQNVMRTKWTADGRTLNMRIKTLRQNTTTTVRKMIRQGVRDGKGAEEIARDIRQFVKPSYSKTQVRGKMIKSPISGSVQYNAIRIARTETAEIYRTALIAFYKDADYVKAWGWYLSNRHPKTDECNDYSKMTWEDPLSIPHSHPNCLCDIRPIFLSEEELRRRA